MTVFYAGSEPEILNSFSGTVSTNGSVAVAGINRAGMAFGGAAQSGTAILPALSEGWFHCRFLRTGDIGDFTWYDVLNVTNSSNVTLFRIQSTPNANLATTILTSGRVQFFGGSAAYAGEIDVHFKFAASGGFIRIYLNQALWQEVTGNTLPASGAAALGFMYLRGTVFSSGTTYAMHYSQFLIADTPTLGARVHTLPLTVSTTNQWTGTPTNVTGTSTLGVISESTNNEEISFTAADLATAIREGYRIDGAVISNKSQFLTGSPVTQLQGRVRVGATPYSVDTLKALTTGYNTVQHIASVDPSTGVTWTSTGLNAAEFGLQART